MSVPETSSAGLSHAAALVQKQAPDFFFRLLFLPADKRESLFVILGLYYELERIRFQVKEKMLGLIRLQWWRDELKALQNNQQQSSQDPLILALSEVMQQSGQIYDDLLTLIDGQEYLYNDSQDCRDLDLYLHRCQAEFLPVLQAICHILEVDSPLSQLAGFAQTEVAVRHLRYASRYAALRPAIFPIATDAGPAALQNIQNHPDIQAMVAQIITRISPEKSQKWPKPVSFLSEMQLCQHAYLKRFQKQSCQLFDPIYGRPAGFGLKLRIALKGLIM